MKKINKTEPDFYKEYIKKNKPSCFEDFNNYGIRSEMRQYMLSNEQNHQCAYTEVNINADNSHIDHFKKQEFILQGKFKGLNVFSWENLLTSCNTESFGGKYKDNTYKIKFEDYNSIVNPVLDETSNYFKYNIYGEIIPINDKAQKTIEVFKLDDKSLTERRYKIAKSVIIYYNQGYSLEVILKMTGCFESMIRNLYNQLQK